jgi:hypothetical protein
VGIVQLNVPVFGVLVAMVWATTPALSTSIFTYDPTLPKVVQVIGCIDPGTQDSPPFGDVTVIEGVVVPVLIVKALLLESVYALLLVLVILIL